MLPKSPIQAETQVASVIASLLNQAGEFTLSEVTRRQKPQQRTAIGIEQVRIELEEPSRSPTLIIIASQESHPRTRGHQPEGRAVTVARRQERTFREPCIPVQTRKLARRVLWVNHQHRPTVVSSEPTPVR